MPAPTLLTFTVAARTVAPDGPTRRTSRAALRRRRRHRRGPARCPRRTSTSPSISPKRCALTLLHRCAAAPRGHRAPAGSRRRVRFRAWSRRRSPPMPPGTVVWRHDGEPLRALLADMWLPSDNLIAEELLREIDVAANARAGTLEGGTALERTWLRGIGVDPATLTTRRRQRALAVRPGHAARPGRRCCCTIGTARTARPCSTRCRSPASAATSRGAMRGTPAEGHVFAKTGSMSHVRGLAGYVTTRTHGTLVFALSIDDWIGSDADLGGVAGGVLLRGWPRLARAGTCPRAGKPSARCSPSCLLGLPARTSISGSIRGNAVPIGQPTASMGRPRRRRSGSI